MNKIATALVAGILIFALAPAAAQDAPPTLRVDSGNVMVGQGGGFETALTGKVVEPGMRVLVTENSAATIVYANGATVQFTVPGVYVVQATPIAASGSGVAVAAGATDLIAIGIIGGIVVASAGLMKSNMEEVPYVPPPPVSQ